MNTSFTSLDQLGKWRIRKEGFKVVFGGEGGVKYFSYGDVKDSVGRTNLVSPKKSKLVEQLT